MAAPEQPPLRRRPDEQRPQQTRSNSAADSNGVKPYVSDDARLPEFTWTAVLLGAVLGIIFGASSLYLVLKVGMTVSASIPVAVLSITLFRGLAKAFRLRPATILENNIVQTTGSAGESIAFGVGVTMPALMLLGFDMSIGRVMVVSILGGLLGILMMIPLRRAFIVRMHRELKYPEGTACAEVLISGDQGGSSGRLVFVGFFLAFVQKFLTEGMGVLRETVSVSLKDRFNRVAALTTDLAPELLGVGYIIGMKTASVMMAGAVIGNLVIVPAIAMFGDAVPGLISPGTQRISQMDISDIQVNYLRYIGAGCVTAAGIISMFRTMPMIVRSAMAGIRGLGGSQSGGGRKKRTERDMSLITVVVGSLVLLVVLAGILMTEVKPWTAILGAALVLAFGFLFVTVSSRLTGEIGSSSNPISGMTVATLALTCLIFASLGMRSPTEAVLALSIAAVVCIAASNGGTTSQDLKTGYLIGGTPYWQQWAIVIGSLTSALVIGVTLLLLNEQGTVYSTRNLPQVVLSQQTYDALTTHATFDNKDYRVWWPRAGEYPNVLPGKYYVDEYHRPVVYVDPAITGRLTKRDNGEDVKFKFPAPKTQVMGIIINGVLGGTLNWGLVLIGVMLAVGIELCGESSLAFAVGVYIPMQYTSPIFMGGMLAWFTGSWRNRGKTKASTDEAMALAEAETGAGTLLSSGYIAGGTLAGVTAAFLEFSTWLKNKLDFEKPLAGTFANSNWFPVTIFGVLIVILAIVGMRRADNGKN
ncbi:MAG TPA: oligopeptide transporter, OPT family [Pirellulales bacterium]|nr:oligopeptide transporter, OPT family [Pirellulales bacterium]